MPSVCQLLYVSSVTTAYDDAAIQNILHIARRNNRKLDITGCLLYSGRNFAQVLEGPSAVVLPLARRIANDPRHTNVRVLLESHRGSREYGEWSMGYLHDLSLEDQVDALSRAGAGNSSDIADVLSRMKPDTVIGALR